MTTSTLRIVVAGVCFVGLVLGVIYFGSMKEKNWSRLMIISNQLKINH